MVSDTFFIITSVTFQKFVALSPGLSPLQPLTSNHCRKKKNTSIFLKTDEVPYTPGTGKASYPLEMKKKTAGRNQIVSDKGKNNQKLFIEKKEKNSQGRFCKTHDTMAVVKWLQARQRKQMRWVSSAAADGKAVGCVFSAPVVE